MQSYDYARREGVEEISWERFAGLSRSLAERLAGRGVDAVVGLARAGLFPAAAVACALRCDLLPVRVTRRSNDRVVARIRPGRPASRRRSGAGSSPSSTRSPTRARAWRWWLRGCAKAARPR